MRPVKSLRRVHRILAVVLEHGLTDVFGDHALGARLSLLKWLMPWRRNRYPDKPRGWRLRHALQELGPVFVKFGQMLSTRRDLLPDDIADELTLLQDQVRPFSGDKARAVIERRLGKPVTELFAHFDQEPMASASMAQVHAATLMDGREVVVKVLRPGIAAQIARDMGLMHTLARLVERFLPDGRRFKPVEVISDYERTIYDELNLMREAANAAQMRRLFLGSRLLYVPEVHWEYCDEKVMVMERIHGIPVDDTDTLRAVGVDMKKLAERGVEIFFTQVFRDSFFHADMHPGNIFVDASDPADPTYIGVDCGIIGTLSKDDQRYLAENFLAFFDRDYRRVAELHVESGWVPAGTRVEDFEAAIRTVCEPIFGKPLAQISFAQFLIRLFATARRFQMEVQPQLVLLQKTLLYVEGLGRQLYPDLDLWATAKPFLENWLKQRLGPKTLWRKLKHQAPLWLEKLPDMPDLVYRHLEQNERLGREVLALKQAEQERAQVSGQRRFRLRLLALACLVAGAFAWQEILPVWAGFGAGIGVALLLLVTD